MSSHLLERFLIIMDDRKDSILIGSSSFPPKLNPGLHAYAYVYVSMICMGVEWLSLCKMPCNLWVPVPIYFGLYLLLLPLSRTEYRVGLI